MIKILQIDSSSNIGGGQIILRSIVLGVKDSFRFIVAAPTGKLSREYTLWGIPFYDIGGTSVIACAKEIRSIIQRECPDIVHMHGTRAAMWTRVASIGLKKKQKLLYTLHGFHIIRKSLWQKKLLLTVERFLNHWVDALICVSEEDRNVVNAFSMIASRKVFLIRNGIDIRKFQVSEERRKELRKRLRVENSFVILAPGRLHAPKDFSTVLHAFALCLQVKKNLKLLIAGTGELEEKLQLEAEKLNLGTKVRFVGFVEDMPLLYSAADVVILSTEWEGLPLVPLEAGAAHRPVISSEVAGVREVVMHGKTGLLFPFGSIQGLKDVLLTLYGSSDLRKKLGEANFRFVAENFSHEKMLKEYRNLYLDILSEGKTRR